MQIIQEINWNDEFQFSGTTGTIRRMRAEPGTFILTGGSPGLH